MLYLLLVSLLALSLLHPGERTRIRNRKSQEWLIDAISLATHFLLLPVAQLAIAYKLYAIALPEAHAALSIGWGAALLLSMAIDYGWYWNHRLFHAQTPLWNLHAVHHEAQSLDILATTRNSLWSAFFMVYFWLQPLVLYLAKDPIPFLTMSAIGLIINFWGHTGLNFPQGSLPKRLASLLFVQPEDHFWHHSAENPYCNFATVFNLWDRLHGTWYQPQKTPEKLGFDLKLPLWKKVLFPIQRSHGGSYG